MDTGAKRSQRDYELTFKLSVVDQVEKGKDRDLYDQTANGRNAYIQTCTF
ncbi:hypothetical protein [Pseudomonas sp. P5_C3]